MKNKQNVCEQKHTQLPHIQKLQCNPIHLLISSGRHTFITFESGTRNTYHSIPVPVPLPVFLFVYGPLQVELYYLTKNK